MKSQPESHDLEPHSTITTTGYITNLSSSQLVARSS